MMALRRLGKPFVFFLLATLIPLVLLEFTLRALYAFRNTHVQRVALPYVTGNDYGPTPPWLESLQILAEDKNLIWHNRPNLVRTYVDHFRPAVSESQRL